MLIVKFNTVKKSSSSTCLTLFLNEAKEINNALNQNSFYPKKQGQKAEKGCKVPTTNIHVYHQRRSTLRPRFINNAGLILRPRLKTES